MRRRGAWAFMVCACVGGCKSPEATGTARGGMLTANALTANALTANALTADALTANGLSDTGARSVLEYVVSCALPAGAHLDVEVGGVRHRFDGQLGLAPSWGREGGTCDATCQAWISGCLIARLNHRGERVHVSLRGAHPALAPSPDERRGFPNREATYFGDVFRAPQQLLACLPPGATGAPRVCGASTEGCAVRFVGSCRDACDGELADGSFTDCHDRVRGVDGRLPADAVTYPGSITVFLP